MNHMNPASHCKCPHHKIGAYLIILFGIFMLLGTMGVISGMIVAYSFPILIILFGLTRAFGGSCKCYMKSSNPA